MKPMKVTIFTDTFNPQMNGVVAYLNDSIKLLSKNNKVVVFAPGKDQFRTETPDKNLKIYWIPSTPFPFYEGYRIASIDYKRISSLIKKERPDIIHAHAPVNLGLQGLIAAKRRGIPSIVTYHTHFPDYVPHLLNGKMPEVLKSASIFTVKKMIKHIFKNADMVTAPTRELMGELRSYGLKNVTYLPNGIDFKKLDLGKHQVNEFREKHGIPKNKKIILYLGRVSIEKKLDKLLEAFKRIENDTVFLVVAGGGQYVKKFRKLAKKMEIKNIIFTGFIEKDHVGAAYACADIFASASDSETFGLTFVEAMHFRLPVIGIRILGPKELIRHGRNGFLVEPGDTAAFGMVMAKLLEDDDLRRRLGSDAEKSSRRYSIEKSVEKTLKLYSSLINGRSKTSKSSLRNTGVENE